MWHLRFCFYYPYFLWLRSRTYAYGKPLSHFFHYPILSPTNLFYHLDNIGLSKRTHIIVRWSRFITLTHIIEFSKPGLWTHKVSLLNKYDIDKQGLSTDTVDHQNNPHYQICRKLCDTDKVGYILIKWDYQLIMLVYRPIIYSCPSKWSRISPGR